VIKLDVFPDQFAFSHPNFSKVLTIGTNPLLTDSDGNGTPDRDEDNDGDGFTNAEELQCQSDPIDPYSRSARALPWLMLLLE
jgi:hypothetical protein